jgi:hypothetical protein
VLPLQAVQEGEWFGEQRHRLVPRRPRGEAGGRGLEVTLHLDGCVCCCPCCLVGNTGHLNQINTKSPCIQWMSREGVMSMQHAGAQSHLLCTQLE